MRKALLLIAIGYCTLLHAQVPIIDYSFQALPPSIMINRVVEQPDGKILLAGAFQNYAGSGKNNLVRLNNDGTVDPTFNPGGSGPSHIVHDLALMNDGRIIIGGIFSAYNGQPSGFVLRLHADGTRDAGFQVPPNTINSAVLAVEVHVENKVLAAGEFNLCQGHSQPHITRFNYDGSLDTTFIIGSGFNMPVRDLLVLPDMRVLCTGDFWDYDGNTCGRIALLSPGGPFDASMTTTPGLTGTGARGLTLERQADGKILIGGRFTHHNGATRGGLSRMDITGALDPLFTSPFYPYAEVRAIAEHVDGKIFVGGSFSSAMYSPNLPGPNNFLRLHADGSQDDAYPVGQGILPGAAATAFVDDIHVQADRKILVGGAFQFFDTESQYQQIIRLMDEELSTGLHDHTTAPALHGHWDLSSGILHLATVLDVQGPATLQIHGMNGAFVAQQQVSPRIGDRITVPGEQVPGIYLVRLIQDDRVMTGRVLAR